MTESKWRATNLLLTTLLFLSSVSFVSGEETINVDSDWVHCLAISPDGKKLHTGGSDGKIRTWDIETGKLIGKPSANLSGPAIGVVVQQIFGPNEKVIDARKFSGILSLAYSPDGKQLAIGCADGAVRIIDMEKKKFRVVLRSTTQKGTGAVTALAWAPDSKKLISGHTDSVALVWSGGPSPAVPPLPLTDHKGILSCAVFNADGNGLATADLKGDVLTLGMKAKLNRATLHHGERGVNAVILSTDGKTLVSAGLLGKMKFWDLATATQQTTIDAHPAAIKAMVLSPDGKILATGSVDKTIRLWDFKTRKRLATLKGHKRAITCLAFTPNGSILASSSTGGNVKLWDVAKIRKETKQNRKFPKNKHNLESASRPANTAALKKLRY